MAGQVHKLPLHQTYSLSSLLGTEFHWSSTDQWLEHWLKANNQVYLVLLVFYFLLDYWTRFKKELFGSQHQCVWFEQQHDFFVCVILQKKAQISLRLACWLYVLYRSRQDSGYSLKLSRPVYVFRLFRNHVWHRGRSRRGVVDKPLAL